MAVLNLQTFIGGWWLDCATLSIERLDGGVGSPSRLEYEIDYFIQEASVDSLKREVRDLRAVSVRNPVDMRSYTAERWLPFVLDLIPQGAMRRRFAAERRWRDDDPRLDYLLLLRGAGSPIGNIRVREAREEDERNLRGATIEGVPMRSILQLDDAFMEVWTKVGLTTGGSEGVQGDWPKILMTKRRDGLWYPDACVPDRDAIEHVLVKRAHPKIETNRAILRNEPGYLELARQFGLRVGAPLRRGRDVVVIPRFDRRVDSGAVVRLGQESLASAIGTSEFGASAHHTCYVDAIRRFATDPATEILEYVLRDVLNLAAGNPDNHGRNTAFQKFPDGHVALTPIFDFAPMKLFYEGPRTTRWTDVTLDSTPDWVRVAEVACAGVMDPAEMLSALKSREEFIRELPDRAKSAGIDDEIIATAMIRHSDIADTLATIPEPGPKP